MMRLADKAEDQNGIWQVRFKIPDGFLILKSFIGYPLTAINS